MRLLVTGGAGYVGSHVVQVLRRAGFSCVVLDNLSRGHRELARPDELIVGDIGDTELVGRILVDRRIEGVLHFAALAYVGESMTDPAAYYRNNVGGTLDLLTSMVRARVNKIVFSSTCATYGMPESVPMTEDHPQRPVNPYGASKLMVERILQDFDRAYGMKSIVLRYFNAAGADPGGEIGEWHEPETHLIPLVLQAASGERDAVEIYGTDYPTPDGTCIRDYIHVTDLAEAHVLGLRRLLAGEPSEVFNLGNGAGFSVRTVIETAQRITGRPIRSVEAPRRPGDPDTLVGSSEKARRILGWKPRFDSLESILETAWNWHRSRAELSGGRTGTTTE